MCDVEEIPIKYVITAMECLVMNDVHYRQGHCSTGFLMCSLILCSNRRRVYSFMSVPDCPHYILGISGACSGGAPAQAP